MEYVNCNLCYSSKYKVFNTINSNRLVKCKKCGLVYLNPRPDQKEIADKYSAEYHIGKLLGQEPKTEFEIEEEINKNVGRTDEIVRQFGTRGKLLDIGGRAGFFIASLQRCGWDVTGIDISEWASKLAREKLWLDDLLIDEVLSVGDYSYRTKCAEKITELRKRNTTIMLVYHNLDLIYNVCERVIYLNEGKLVFEGDTLKGIETYINMNNKRINQTRRQANINNKK